MTLVVDLDGSLIRTDMLVECFFAALVRRPGETVAALGALGAGRAALKARLAAIAAPDVAHLPYNEPVLEALRAARAEGRRTALVSAADARLVAAVAEHLGLFDEAHGSNGAVNLKGPAKAAFLVDRFGEGAFDYVGDARADLAVWDKAGRAITVGADPALVAEVERLRPGATHLAPPPGGLARLRPYLRAMRPHQWLKNALIFLPLLAAHTTEAGVWLAAVLAAIAFSLTASSVYLLNDLLDIGADRAHPRKRLRPFAAGTAGLVPGAALAGGLLVAAFAVAALLPAAFLSTLGVYYALTLAYSMGLKRLLVLDIVTLGGLYTIRVIAGGAAAGVPLSAWMLAFCGFLFFALAAVKRQAELVDGRKTGRETAAGRAYTVEDWPVVTMIALSAGHAAVVVLALYIASEKVQALYATPAVLWGICPVLLFWICRMVMITHRGAMTDDPLVYAVRDPVSLGAGAACLGLGVAGALL